MADFNPNKYLVYFEKKPPLNPFQAEFKSGMEVRTPIS